MPSFWRWPAGFAGGRRLPALTAQIDMLPTLAEIVGVTLDGELWRQVEGRSLLPLLKDPHAAWPDRMSGHARRALAARAGGRRQNSKTARSATAVTRWSRTRSCTICKPIPAKRPTLSTEHPDVVASLRTAYDDVVASGAALPR